MRPFDDLTDAGRVRRYRAVALDALRHYDLPGARLVPVGEGECMVFRVEAAERYALRLHNPAYQDEPRVRSELAWLTSLHAAGFAVPEPVRTRDGDALVVAASPGIGAPRACDVTTWLDGRFAYERVGAHAMHEVGRFLGGLHAHAFDPPPWFERHRWDGEHVFGRPVEDALAAVRPVLDRADLAEVERALDLDREARGSLGTGPGAFGLIHADLTAGNVLWRRREPRVLDFDDCGWGHYLYDIAVTLSHVERRAGFPVLRDALLRGYRTECPLPPEHEPMIAPLMATRRFSLMAWQVIRWGDGDVAGYADDIRRILARG